MRTTLVTLAAALGGLLATAAPAAAATLTLEVGPRSGVVLGNSHRLAGLLTADDGEPLADQVVTLEAKRHPYDGEYREIARGTTGPVGEYRFDPEFDRNVRLRVSAVGIRRHAFAYVFPRAKISVRTVGRNRVRLFQTLTGPKGAEIRGVTRFYVGRARAKSARFADTAPPRRREPGRYVARRQVRIPKAFNGRFSYAACFRASEKSGMGDPRVRCPRRRYRF